jgi:hypothetical protein
MSRIHLLYVACGVFILTLAAAWLTQGRGVVHDDAARNIAVPDTLLMPLELQVAYNDRDIFFRYRWPAKQPHIYIDMWRYTHGKWVRHGKSPVGPEPHGIYEDRVTMLVDDGSVPEFRHYGGYITADKSMRFMTGAASAETVGAHPHLGQSLGQNDVRKYLPATRKDLNDWKSVVDEETLARQREAGYFLDLWHWRAHRSNPVNVSDDQFVAEYRSNDSGAGSFYTNWDAEGEHPKMMFNQALTGMRALDWNRVSTNQWDFDSLYYLSEDMAEPFDPDHAWQEGDTIPRQIIREPSGSRGSIRVDGLARWNDGYWEVALVRAKDTGSPLDDKIFRDQGVYDIAVAVHRNATGSRWHYVSLPLQVGLGREAQIQAHRFAGDSPDWGEVAVRKLELFYPGQVDWASLVSRRHAGADKMQAGVPVRVRHSEKQLAFYAVEGEFNTEILRQWLLTLIAGVLLIVAFGAAVSNLLPKQGDR